MGNLEREPSDSETYKVAVASSDGIVVNQHFGRADSFYIYEVAEADEYRLLETRAVMPVCNRRDHDDDQLINNVDKLQDCKYILVSRIGSGAANIVEQFGIIPMELPGIIGESIEKLIKYRKLQNLFI